MLFSILWFLVWWGVHTTCLTTLETTYKQNMLLCCRITTSPHMNTHILIQWFELETIEFPDDDQMLIETCRSAFNCFSFTENFLNQCFIILRCICLLIIFSSPILCLGFLKYYIFCYNSPFQPFSCCQIYLSLNIENSNTWVYSKYLVYRLHKEYDVHNI
jgi:hypothetical protein